MPWGVVFFDRYVLTGRWTGTENLIQPIDKRRFNGK
jgi:hypothetical protein